MDLTHSQKKVIETFDKPLVVLAGPGSGKTHTITNKITSLINDKKLDPNSILALTFTQKAADEMSERVNVLGDYGFRGYTFHSFALDILQEYSKYINHFPSNYILIEEIEQVSYFYENLDSFSLQSVEVKDKLNVAKELNSSISKLKDYGFSLKNLDSLNIDVDLKVDLFSVYSSYELWKQKNHFVDFGDLLLSIKNLFLENHEILNTLRKKYGYILVDEFQDCNLLQLEIIDLLSSNNICVVGDFKQSIYSFRGSYEKVFDEFKKRKKESVEIILEDNFRSSKNVLNLVNHCTKLMGKNKEVMNSNLEISGSVSSYRTLDEDSQFSLIVEQIQETLSLNPEAKIGILTRRKAEALMITEKLSLTSIRSKSFLDKNFFEDGLVDELLKVLIFLSNPKEKSIELFYLLSQLGVRESVILDLSRKSSLNEKSLFNVLKKCDGKFCSYEEDNKIILDFYNNILNLIELKDSNLKLKSFILKVIEKFSFYKRALILEENLSVFELNKFLKFIDRYVKVYSNEDFNGFLKYCLFSQNFDFSLDHEDQKDNFSVEILTVHQSKGKEYDKVILPYLNERKFPLNFKKPLFDLGLDFSREDFLDEELRLFFVAISRTKKDLILSYVNKFESNKNDSKPSVFLKNLDLKFQDYNLKYDFVDLKELKHKDVLMKKIFDALLAGRIDEVQSEVKIFEEVFLQKENNLLSFSKSQKAKELIDEIEGDKKNLDYDFSKHVYSVSQLKTYEQCPKKYKYNYVYKIPTPSKHYFDFGTSMHDVLENLIPQIDSKISKDDILVRALSLLSQKWISKSYDSSSQEREYFEKGVDVISKFIDLEFDRRSKLKREVACLEQEFFLDIEGRRVMGYIDRIDRLEDGSFEIIDYKTSNSKLPKNQLKEDLQLYVYALALKSLKKYGEFPKSMGLWYLVFNQIEMIDFDEHILQELKKKILSLIQAIEKQNFEANPSLFSCKYCDFSSICSDKF